MTLRLRRKGRSSSRKPLAWLLSFIPCA